jgi:hypothetical protein
MSRVTVVPARSAESQISRACSSAIRSPSPGSAWPTAESLTLNSALAARPSPESRSSSVQYAFVMDAAWAASVVSSPRWSRLTASPWPASSRVTRTASSADSPATYRATTLRLTGAAATTRLTRSLRAAARITERNMRPAYDRR